MSKLLTLTALLLAFSLSATVSLPGIFSDHAVLAKNEKVPVFGKAAPGEKVTVEFNGQKRITVADRNGKWRVDLNLANSPEGPFELKVNDLIIKDVLVGEVWLCSGQSNMAWQLRSSEGYKEAMKNPGGRRLRAFNIIRTNSETPIETVRGKWICADAGSIGEFSGVGYFFGRRLLEELNTPVGLINNAWGGSTIEGWMTVEAAKIVPAVAKRDKETILKKKNYPQMVRKYAADLAVWANKNNCQDLPHRPVPSDARWSAAPHGYIPGGVTWLRRTIEVSKAESTRPLRVTMPRQYAPFTAWVDGKKVYEFDVSTMIISNYAGFQLPPLAPGRYELMLRYYDPVNPRIRVPEKLTIGKTVFDGVIWEMFNEKSFAVDSKSAPKLPGRPPRDFFNTQRLFNGCIYPILPYALDGVIWYQGESNVAYAEEYEALMRALIMDWRKHFEAPELPFYWCSLAGYKSKIADPGFVNGWVLLRKAQTAALDIPHTGQAVLTDVCEVKDIHPGNKHIPGERLAAIALANVYGRKIPFAGPAATAVVREGNSLRISFKDVCGGLEARPVPDKYYVIKRLNRTGKLVRNSPRAQLEGFAVCGRDGKWFWADRAEIAGDTVVVASGKVAEPFGVRYAWQQNPTCNLFNKAGFPAVPFEKMVAEK